METTRRRKKRLTSVLWAEVLGDHRGSGMTQEAFGQSGGVRVAALRNHLYRRCRDEDVAALGRGFLPVRLRGGSKRTKGERVAMPEPALVVRWPQATGVELRVAPSMLRKEAAAVVVSWATARQLPLGSVSWLLCRDSRGCYPDTQGEGSL